MAEAAALNDSSPLPSDLSSLLADFTSAVLAERPPSLPHFAADYFTRLASSLGGGQGLLSVPLQVVHEDGDVSDRRPSSSSAPVGMRRGRRESICAESYDPSKGATFTYVVHAKTEAQRKRLTESLGGILLFRALEADQMQRVVDAMFERRVSQGQRVIEQGADGDNFYVVESGRFEALVTSPGSKAPRSVCLFNGKGFFGELALMYNQPRAATIVALSDGVLWAMDRLSFKHIVLQSAHDKRVHYESLLSAVPMLKHLDVYERMNVADALVSRTFTSGERIIREGDPADGMYFVEDGQVRVTIRKGSREVEACKIAKGKYFGEKALVENSPRTASVYAIGSVKVAFLERESFERLLGPCLDIMKREMKAYKKSSS